MTELTTGDAFWKGVTLVLLLAALLAYALYVWRQRAYRETMERIAVLGKLLRQHQTAQSQALNNLSCYTDINGEPYASMILQVATRLEQQEDALRNLQQDYGAIRELVNHRPNNGLLHLPARVVADERVIEHARRLERQFEDYAIGMDELQTLEAALDDLPWAVSAKLKELNRILGENGDALEELWAAGWRGDQLDDQLEQHHQRQKALHDVPVLFFSNEKELLLRSVEREDVVVLYELCEDLGGKIEEGRRQASQWVGCAEKLNTFGASAKSGYAALLSMAERLRTSEHFPLEPDQTQGQMGRLGERLNNFETAYQLRDADRLVSLAHEADDLLEHLSSLTEHYKKLGMLHAEFLGAAAAPEVLGWGRMLAAKQKVVTQGLSYAADNFERGDRIDLLTQEICSLQQLGDEIGEVFPLKPVRETELEKKLLALRAFRATYAGVDGRVKSIEMRLKALQERETALSSALAQASETLQQIAGLEEVRRRWNREIQKQQQVLEAQERSLTQKKQHENLTKIEQRAEQAVVQVTAEVGKWLEAYSAELTQDYAQIWSKVEAINKNLRLEDPALDGLSNWKLRFDKAVAVAANHESPFELEDMVALLFELDELDAAFESWENDAIASLRPVQDVFLNASQHREKAGKLIEKVRAAFPEGGRGWPPTLQHLGQEDYRFRRLETAWGDLPYTRCKVGDALKLLKEMSDQYQQLGNQLIVLERSVAADQEKFFAYERRLEESLRLWRQQGKTFKTSPILQEGIADLLGEIERRRDKLKRDYQDGYISYQQALGQMRGICRHCDESILALDDQRRIDINGQPAE